jgi:hypothetical protein
VETISAAVGASVAINGLLLWILSSWLSERLKNAIRHEYDQKLETHRAQLQKEAEIEVIKARYELERSSLEWHIKFSRLHEKSAEAIATIYAKLAKARSATHYACVSVPPELSKMMQGDQSTRGEAAKKTWDDLVAYFESHRLYLPQPTAVRIKEVIEKFHAINLFRALLDFHGSIHNQDHTTLRKKVEAGLEYVSPLLEALEDDFRVLLGSAKPTEGSAS